MNEQDRRQEILKAEEVIRQLAAELGRAKDAAATAEATRQSLAQAGAALTGATEAIQTTQGEISKAGYDLDAAARRLEAATKNLNDGPQELADALNKERAKLGTEFDAAAKRLEQAVRSLSDALASQLGKFAEAQQVQSSKVRRLLTVVIIISTASLLLGLIRLMV